MATSIVVTIGSTSYQVYADVASTDAYLNASLSSQAVAWRAATTDTKGRGLVEATRWLDQQNWKGTAEDADGLAFPRSGLENYASTIVPYPIIQACMELAALFVADPELRNTLASTATATKRLKAGSVEIEYFRGSSVKTRTPMPTLIMGFIKALLDTEQYSGIGGFNTDREGDFGDDDDFDLNT